MLLDVTLDLVLDEVGDDRVQHRAEDEVLDPLGSGGIDERHSHLALTRMQRRPDVIDLPHPTDRCPQDRRVADVPDDHVVDACRPQLVGGSL